jgi:hypothetical protein
MQNKNTYINTLKGLSGEIEGGSSVVPVDSYACKEPTLRFCFKLFTAAILKITETIQSKLIQN